MSQGSQGFYTILLKVIVRNRYIFCCMCIHDFCTFYNLKYLELYQKNRNRWYWAFITYSKKYFKQKREDRYLLFSVVYVKYVIRGGV